MTSASSGALARKGLVDVSRDERRTSQRKVISLQAKLHLPDGTTLDGQTADISETGIGFYSQRMLPSEQDCRLSVRLSACGTETELRLVGRICYCREQSVGKFRVGMRFIGLQTGAAELLAAMLK